MDSLIYNIYYIYYLYSEYSLSYIDSLGGFLIILSLSKNAPHLPPSPSFSILPPHSPSFPLSFSWMKDEGRWKKNK